MVLWRIGSDTHLRKNELNQKKGRVWMILSVKRQKKWRSGIRLKRNPAERDFTTQELLQDLGGDDWANTATSPLASSPRKDLEYL